jgi:hypothetical protein
MSLASYLNAFSGPAAPADLRKPFCLVAGSSLGDSRSDGVPPGACLSSFRARPHPACGRGTGARLSPVRCGFLILILIVILIVLDSPVIDEDYD